MRVLLLGEYSGVHTNLAKALREKEINVCTVHDGDSYKKFESDILISYKRLVSKNKYVNFILRMYYQILLFLGISGCIQILFHTKKLKKLKNYDVVQLINPVFLSGFGSIVNIIVLRFLVKNNKKIFLCALGDDYIWVKGSIENKEFKSMFYFMRVNNLRQYFHSMMYLYGFFYKFLNNYAINVSHKVIPGLYDYYYYYRKFNNCVELIPVPIEIDRKIEPTTFTGYPIKIFHGWQPNKEFRKGNIFFDDAVKKLIKKYPGKISYKIIGGVPYSEYIKTFNDSHIFLDQCLSMDQGVNALIALAKGKVVFSGLSDDLIEYYNLKNQIPLINSKPDVDYIYEKLEFLILNPSLLEVYSKNSISFMLDKHEYNYVVSQYLKVWNDLI